MNIQFFSDKLISQNSSKPLIVRSFYLLRMSDDYCFRRAAQRQLSQCNRRNTATVLRAVVKSHNLPVSILEEISKICREEPLLGSFYRKVAACNNL